MKMKTVNKIRIRKDDKDEVKSVDLVDAPVIEKHSIWKQENNAIKRGNSIQSCQLNNMNNFTASFIQEAWEVWEGLQITNSPSLLIQDLDFLASPEETIVSK